MISIGVLQGRLTPSHGRGIQFFPQENWEQEFDDARTAGITSIELLVRPQGLREHPLMYSSGRKRLKQRSKKTGVHISSVHGYYALEDSYADDVVDIVTASADVGAMVVLVSFFKEKKLSPTRDGTWDRAYELLGPAARAAKNTGIRLGIEAELPASVLKEFINGAETPEAFGVYYDLGNQFACGFAVADEIRDLKDMIVGIHVKDRQPVRNANEESATVPLGEGCADFMRACMALRDIGYSRPLIIQGARGVDGDELERNTKYREFTEAIAKKVWNS